MLRDTWNVRSLKYRSSLGKDVGRVIELTKIGNIGVAINDSSELQIGPVGRYLQWLHMSSLRLIINSTDQTATFTHYEGSIKFTVSLILEDNVTRSPLLPLLLTDQSGAILGIVRVVPPDGRNESLSNRAGAVAANRHTRCVFVKTHAG
jgi:hypothetical protein